MFVEDSLCEEFHKSPLGIVSIFIHVDYFEDKIESGLMEIKI